jgi:hypothetical protein
VMASPGSSVAQWDSVSASSSGVGVAPRLSRNCRRHLLAASLSAIDPHRTIY